MKDIIFTIISLSVFIGGTLLFEHFQEKFEDSSWFVVLFKIVVAIVLLVAYAVILKYAAIYFDIRWK